MAIYMGLRLVRTELGGSRKYLFRRPLETSEKEYVTASYEMEGVEGELLPASSPEKILQLPALQTWTSCISTMWTAS